MRAGAEQQLLARLPVLGQLAFRRLQHAAIDQALRVQARDRILDPPGAVQRLLAGIDVHLDAQDRQVAADLLHHRLRREFADLLQPFGLGAVQQAVAVLGLQRLSDGDQIVAGIQPLADLGLQPVRLAIALVCRAGQHVDLRAAVIDIVFARDVMAGERQQPRQRIAEDRAADMAHMHRTGGVGADELDVDLGIRPKVGPPEFGAGLQGRPDHALPDHRRQAQVQETGARDLGRADAGVGQARGQAVGDLARLHAGGLGQHHRGIGGHVAMRRVAGRFDRDIGGIQACGQLSCGGHLVQRLDDDAAQIGEKVHHGLPD